MAKILSFGLPSIIAHLFRKETTILQTFGETITTNLLENLTRISRLETKLGQQVQHDYIKIPRQGSTHRDIKVYSIELKTDLEKVLSQVKPSFLFPHSQSELIRFCLILSLLQKEHLI